MKLELSIVTYIPYLPLSAAIERAEKLKFSLFEIPGDRPHGWPPDLGKKDRIAINSYLQKHNLFAEIITVNGSYLIGPGLCNDNRNARSDAFRYIQDLIELGSDIGCSKLVMLPGRPLLTMPSKVAYQLAIQGLGECADFAKEHGMLVCVENTPYKSWLLDTAEKIMQVFNDVSANNLAVRLDPCHAHVSKVDFRHLCLKLKDRIHSVGLHDNKGDADTHLPIGQGDVNICSALTSLKEVGYDGSLSIEILPSEAWSIDTVDSYIIQSKKVVEDWFAG